MAGTTMKSSARETEGVRFALPSASAGRREERGLRDLFSVGPATVEDLRVLGITTVAELAAHEPRELYERLCSVTGQRHDPCCEDVFAAAIAQARDPELEGDACRWWYWSRLRKSRSN